MTRRMTTVKVAKGANIRNIAILGTGIGNDVTVALVNGICITIVHKTSDNSVKNTSMTTSPCPQDFRQLC